MTKNLMRSFICLAYIAFFMACCVLVVYAWSMWYVVDDARNELLRHIAAAYALPGGLVLSGLFRTYMDGGDRVRSVIALISVLVVVFWNCITIWPFIYLVMTAGPQNMNIGWVDSYVKSITDVVSFLTAIPLTYFYVKSDL
jgi:hypothetical protein